MQNKEDAQANNTNYDQYNWAVRFIVENAGSVESDRSYNSAPT